jgi:hypothetical protein
MAALLLATGCSKDAGSSTYPEPYADYGGLAEAPVVDITGTTEYQAAPGVAGEYDFAAELADQPSSFDRSVLAAPPARDGKGKANDEAKQQTENLAKAEPGEPAVADDDQTPEHGRQIIYVAGLQLSVYDLDNAMAAVESIPDKWGGWVHMRSQNQLVLRLPAIQLKPVMAELAKLGVVEARSLQAQDVTAEYVDLDSRIKVLRDTQAQLLDLLGKAKTVEEALHVRRALDEVTMELEVALGRMRQLSDQIAYSTLTVTLYERGPQDSIPTSNDPFRWVDSLGVEATEWR